MYIVPHFRYGALIWKMTKENKAMEFGILYNKIVKEVMNIPNKTPRKYIERLLGTWNYEVIIDVSYANNATKWNHLYNNLP